MTTTIAGETVQTKTVKGERTVEIVEGQKQKAPFTYEVITSQGKGLDDVIAFLIEQGYSRELPEGTSITDKGSLKFEGDTEEGEEEEEAGRGKKAIPRSVTWALMYAFKQFNAQEAGAKAYAEAMNTPEKHQASAIAELRKMQEHSKATDAQKKQAELGIRLALAKTSQEKEAIMRELASML